MRICIVGPSKKFYSGVSAYTTVISNAFSENGHEVAVILLRNIVPKFLYPGKSRVGMHTRGTELKEAICVYDGMDWHSPPSWVRAAKFLNDFQPNAIIMHWWTSTVAHMQLFLALIRRICSEPVMLLEMHEVVDPLEESIAPIRLYSRIAGRRLIKLCDGYVVHSTETKGIVSKIYGINGPRIFVVPHGPYDNYPLYGAEGARIDLGLGKEFVLLHFGTIRRYKGIKTLVDAFSMVPEGIARRSRLVIAGEDWGDDPELVPAIKRSPYYDRIIFSNEFVPDEQVGKYFAAADVVVLPYERTCGSGVVSIAKAQRKPIVASDVSTLRECLDGYRGVWFFKVNNVSDLRDQILFAYHKWVIGGLVSKGSTNDFSWEEIIARYVDIISEVRRGQC